MTFLIPFYLTLKALHVLSFMAWMAGLLYLPRLFVYHAQEDPNSPTYATFLTMERRLLRFIMLPAMLATFFFGGLLMGVPGLITWDSTWFFLKLPCVFGLAALHGLMVSWWKGFASHQNKKTALFFRLINEIPFVLAIIIVFLAILKP